MTIQNLVVCGCSFTQGHQLSLNETWGGFVAKKYNWKLHNIARGGAGNEWVSNRTISYLENNRDLKLNSAVMIGWTEASRQHAVFQRQFNSYPTFATVTPKDFVNDRFKLAWNRDDKSYHGYALKYGDILKVFFSSYAHCFYKTYLSILNLKNYLELNSIPYLFFDALSPNKVSIEPAEWPMYNVNFESTHGEQLSFKENLFDSELLDTLTENFANTIFNKNFINFNGDTMFSHMLKGDFEYYTGGNSGHPNLNACEYFSTLIIKEYTNMYPN